MLQLMIELIPLWIGRIQDWLEEAVTRKEE